MKKKLIALSAIVVAIAGCAAYLNLSKFFHIEATPKQINWTEVAKVPGHDEKYKPQGLTWVEGHLILSNHWHDKMSRVYKLDPKNKMQVVEYFDMPAEARHTSGLAWDGENLWAVDYLSNKIYKLDMAASFRDKKAVVIGSCHSTLKGLSACTFVEFEGQKRLIYSDFRNSERNYIIDHKKAISQGSIEGCILASFENAGFSQGLTWTGTYLLDSHGKMGMDVIYCLDLAKAVKEKTYKKAIVQIIQAPHSMVEDMAVHDGKLWTSDEDSFRLYETTGLSFE